MEEFNKRPSKKEESKLWDLTERYTASFEPNTPAALSKLKRRIASEAATNTAVVKPFSRRRILAIAAGFLFLIAGIFFLNDLLSENTAILSAETETNKTMFLALDDGSKVWLNKNSKLNYPETFNAAQRVVQLEGEAYFEIQKNSAKPFIIKTQKNQIEVLGTAFNVRTLEVESFCEVQVKEGKVKFSAIENDKHVILTEKDKGIYDYTTGEITFLDNSAKHAGAWQTNALKFENEQLSLVIPEIERFYNVKIEIRQEEMKQCTLNTRFENTSLEDVLKVLTRVFSFELKKDNTGAFILSGGTC